MKKLITLLFFALVLIVPTVEARDGFVFTCELYTTDGTYARLSESLDLRIYATNEYKIYYSQRVANSRSFYVFPVRGAIEKKNLDVVLSTHGQVAQWQDDTQEDSNWTDITASQQGYLRAEKGKHAQLGKGLIGEAVVPFVNSGNRVLAKCYENDGPAGGCGWFCH